jgi:Rieske Fe-S protein
VRFAGAARFGVGQVAIRLLDDNTGAILGRDNGGFYALSATCTHACCNVNVCADPSCTSVMVNAPACADPQPTTISPTGAAFLCPCHGSAYAADGTVLSGPARSSLPSVATTIEGEDVIVDLSRAVDRTTRTA